MKKFIITEPQLNFVFQIIFKMKGGDALLADISSTIDTLRNLEVLKTTEEDISA